MSGKYYSQYSGFVEITFSTYFYSFVEAEEMVEHAIKESPWELFLEITTVYTSSKY